MAEYTELSLTFFTVICSYAHTVVRLGAGLHLVDQIAHCKRMVLGCTEHQRLLLLVNRFQKQLYPVLLTCLDLDAADRPPIPWLTQRFSSIHER